MALSLAEGCIENKKLEIILSNLTQKTPLPYEDILSTLKELMEIIQKRLLVYSVMS